MESLELRLKRAEEWYEKNCSNTDNSYQKTLIFLKKFNSLHKEVINDTQSTFEQRIRVEYLYESCMFVICSEFDDIANAECYYNSSKNTFKKFKA